MLKNNPLYMFLFISKLTNQLGFGRTLKIKRLNGGAENKSYDVRLHHNKRYVVRILGGGDSERIDNEVYIQHVALQAGVPIGRMREIQNNQYVYEDAGLKATVSLRIKGKHLQTPLLPEQSYEVGKLLGRFHAKAMPDRRITNKYLFVGLEKLEIRMRAIKDVNARIMIERLLGRAQLSELKNLPSGVIHGDLHLKNILSSDEGLVMLDMQSGGYGPFVLDIGRSMADVCNNDDKFDMNLAKSFMEGYRSERSLTHAESRLLLPAALFGAVCVMIWGYQYQKKEIISMFTSIALSIESNILESSSFDS